MASINKATHAVLLTVLALCATVGLANPPQGTNQDKQGDQDSSNQQGKAAKKDNHNEQDKQDSPSKQGDAGKQDKKDNSKSKGATPTLTITVLSDKLAPIKDAAVVLFADDSSERKTTAADGTVAFQLRGGRLTLRITAAHMEPYQKPLQLSGDQNDAALQVVLNHAD